MGEKPLLLPTGRKTGAAIPPDKLREILTNTTALEGVHGGIRQGYLVDRMDNFLGNSRKGRVFWSQGRADECGPAPALLSRLPDLKWLPYAHPGAEGYEAFICEELPGQMNMVALTSLLERPVELPKDVDFIVDDVFGLTVRGFGLNEAVQVDLVVEGDMYSECITPVPVGHAVMLCLPTNNGGLRLYKLIAGDPIGQIRRPSEERIGEAMTVDSAIRAGFTHALMGTDQVTERFFELPEFDRDRDETGVGD